jgi:transcriptional regulator with XRE-family HTH domain
MLKQGLSASEVARRVWGSTKDKRGYDVARNRDRIGHYLAGTSYPEPENLQLLADALGLPIEDLAIDPADPDRRDQRLVTPTAGRRAFHHAGGSA